jgi:hypothetical protein
MSVSERLLLLSKYESFDKRTSPNLTLAIFGFRLVLIINSRIALTFCLSLYVIHHF